MLRRFEHPAHPARPYPPDWTRVGRLRFVNDLVLIRFLDAVQTRRGEDADYIVAEDYMAVVDVDGEDWAITVPKGLITDLTSVPAPLRIIAGRVGPWLEAAIVHDYLYIAWQDVPGLSPRQRDRAFADLVMLRGMEAARVGILKRRLIYAAVRVFGWTAYRRPNEARYVEVPDRTRNFTVPRY